MSDILFVLDTVIVALVIYNQPHVQVEWKLSHSSVNNEM